jgi:RNA polymerase sigma-70 factor (ECF subfamily)
VLELAYFEGLSCTEIAARIQIPVGTVKSRLAAGLDRLRTHLLPGAPS